MLYVLASIIKESNSIIKSFLIRLDSKTYYIYLYHPLVLLFTYKVYKYIGFSGTIKTAFSDIVLLILFSLIYTYKADIFRIWGSPIRRFRFILKHPT